MAVVQTNVDLGKDLQRSSLAVSVVSASTQPRMKPPKFGKFLQDVAAGSLARESVPTGSVGSLRRAGGRRQPRAPQGASGLRAKKDLTLS